MTTASPCDEWAEAISAYADEEASPSERRQVEEHLAACPACRTWSELAARDRATYAEAHLSPAPGEAFVAAVTGKLRAVAQETQPKARRRGTFNLVELFVVLGIIVVLAAIMFPVFAPARDKSRTAACLSNLKQLSLGLLMYADANDGCLPPAHQWRAAIAPQVKYEAMFRCPSDDAKGNCSYAIPLSISGARLAGMPDRTTQPLLYDATPSGEPAQRHNDGLNVAFADGHAKWYADPPPGVERGASLGPVGRNYGLAERLHLAYDASVTMDTREVLRALHAAEQIVREQQGFVLASSFSETRRKTTAHLAFKVPSEQLAGTLVALSRLGRVTRRDVRGQDLTQAVMGAERTRNQSAEREERLRSEVAAARSAFDRESLRAAAQSAQKGTTTANKELYAQRVQTVLATVSATFEASGPRFNAWAGTTRAFSQASGWSARLAGVVAASVVGLAPAWLPAALLIWLGRRALLRRRRAPAPCA